MLDLFLPGILALLAFGSGSSAGFGTIFELQAGVVERFRVTPTSRLALLLGPLVSGDDLDVPLRRRCSSRVGAAFGFHVHSAACSCSPCCSALFMVAMAAFSVAMALVTKEICAFAAVINGINLPVLLLAGVLLPISFGPEWMRVLAHFNPLYYLVVASRSLAHGTFSGGADLAGLRGARAAVRALLAWATRVYRAAPVVVGGGRLPALGRAGAGPRGDQ